MPKTLYLLEIDDNTRQPTLAPVPHRTLTLDGRDYFLVPVPAAASGGSTPEPAEEPEPAAEPAAAVARAARFRRTAPLNSGAPRVHHELVTGSTERILAMHRTGRYSASEIGRIVGLGGATVSKVIRRAGLRTQADDAREAIEEAILEAGEEGASPQALGKIAVDHKVSAGPILTVLMNRKQIKKLPSGNWAVM